MVIGVVGVASVLILELGCIELLHETLDSEDEMAHRDKINQVENHGDSDASIVKRAALALVGDDSDSEAFVATLEERATVATHRHEADDGEGEEGKEVTDKDAVIESKATRAAANRVDQSSGRADKESGAEDASDDVGDLGESFQILEVEDCPGQVPDSVDQRDQRLHGRHPKD